MSDVSNDKKPAGSGEPKKAIIKLRGVRKVYRRDTQEIPVLDGIDLDIAEGSFEALMGPSGSGKTTLLEPDRRHRQRDGGLGRGGRHRPDAAVGGRPGDVARAQHRLHLPVLQSAAGVDRVPERRAAAVADQARRRPSARSASRRRCAWSGSRIAWTTTRASSRAGRSSAWPSRAPSSPIRRSSSPTSRRAISIARAPRRS